MTPIILMAITACMIFVAMIACGIYLSTIDRDDDV